MLVKGAAFLRGEKGVTRCQKAAVVSALAQDYDPAKGEYNPTLSIDEARLSLETCPPPIFCRALSLEHTALLCVSQLVQYVDRVKREVDACAHSTIDSFDLMDTDGDGELTIDELKAYVMANPWVMQCKGMLFTPG